MLLVLPQSELVRTQTHGHGPHSISDPFANFAAKSPYLCKKVAAISGAGIAGLAASFELLAKGYEVFIAEKRNDFSRFNLINLNAEVQAFLRKFNLLEEFETSVAARIKEHKYVVIGKEGMKELFPPSDVSTLQFEGALCKEPEKFKDLFMQDGIYSVPIKDLQAFLAKKAADLGAHILRDTQFKIVDPLVGKRVSKVQLVHKGGSSVTLEPDLFFIAEGAHSDTARVLKMGNEEVKNDCTGENWVFGNLKYSSDKTFVISMIDTTQKTLQIANVIFNGKSKVVNVAVSCSENPNLSEIDHLICSTAKKAFEYAEIQDDPELFDRVKQPVHVTNQIAQDCSFENVFRIGESAGRSSPLAGLGGTIGLTLVPSAVEKVIEDSEKESIDLHSNFKEHSQASSTRWIEKSQFVKGLLLKKFEEAER